MSRIVTLALAGLVFAAASQPALAHVTLDNREARVGSFYKGVLRVPHGCEGTATTAIRVRIPAGMIAVKPMPKPGWTLETKTGAYDKTYSYFHGSMLSEGVVEISWSGGKLPDAWYDEFVFQSFVAGDLTPGETLYVRVVQECEKGVHRWIEIPEPGRPASDLAQPAATLRLVPATPARH
jgi:periplasmic copper chaperone A